MDEGVALGGRGETSAIVARLTVMCASNFVR